MRQPYLPHGLFVTFEGPEGSGKTTQIGLLEQYLRELGYDVLVTREPGGTPLGEELRRILMELRDEELAPESELLLFGACRAQHMRKRILPHLEKGGVVLCDRFADSSSAYQGYARKLNMDFIQRMHELTLDGRWPDLTLLLDISVEESEQRTRQRDGETPVDRFAKENRAFHYAVREGFLNLARHNPKRFRVLAADMPAAELAACIRDEVDNVLR